MIGIKQDCLKQMGILSSLSYGLDHWIFIIYLLREYSWLIHSALKTVEVFETERSQSIIQKAR